MKNGGVQKGCNKFRQIFINFDVLATPFNFYLPDGNTQFRTTPGGIAFLVFSLLFGTYFFSSLLVFLAREEYNVHESSQ